MAAEAQSLRMRAVRVHAYGGPETMRVEEVPMPTPGAGERFHQFTKENALKRIAVLIDGNVVMSARIQ